MNISYLKKALVTITTLYFICITLSASAVVCTNVNIVGTYYRDISSAVGIPGTYQYVTFESGGIVHTTDVLANIQMDTGTFPPRQGNWMCSNGNVVFSFVSHTLEGANAGQLFPTSSQRFTIAAQISNFSNGTVNELTCVQRTRIFFPAGTNPFDPSGGTVTSRACGPLDGIPLKRVPIFESDFNR